MPIRALLTKLAADHEAAGESALAFGTKTSATNHFRVMEAALVLADAMAEVDEEEPARVVRRVPIGVAS